MRSGKRRGPSVFDNNCFNLTYCINTLWYVTNPMKAISELLRVSKPGGTIFFDIMNQYHVEINKLYRRLIFENTTILGNGQKILKNIVKKAFFPKHGYPSWHFIVDQTPLFPDQICSVLPQNTKLFTYTKSFIDITKEDSTNNKFEDYSRVIFLVKKENK